jgi:hypothetical protein
MSAEIQSALDKYQNEKSTAEICCDKFRYFMSTIATIASISLIFYAMGKGYAALPGHPAIHYPLLFFVLTLLAYLEGLQVAILALERVDRNTFSERKKAFASHKLATANRGRNVQRFLVGRQFFVVFVVFLVAQLTTYTQMREELRDIPKFLFILVIETGLPGALIVLAFGQLMPQLIAATHPITFMALPGAWSVIQLCLLFESIGVTHFSWVLAGTTRLLFGMADKENVKVVEETKDVQMRHLHNDNGTDTNKPSTDNENLSVTIMDADKLFAGAEDGLQYASHSTIAEREVLNWLKDDSIRNTYGVSGSDKYPTAPTIVRHLLQNGEPVPRYLLPPYHRHFIAPYIVCFELLRREEHCKKSRGDMQVDVFDENANEDERTQHTA